MNTRRKLLFAIGAAALATPLAALAQQQSKVWRIGYLTSADPAATPHFLDAFRDGMRKHGYVEGKNFVMLSRWATGTAEKFDAVALDIINSKVDVILAWGTPSVKAAMKASGKIPIVMTAVGDPVGAGLIASLAHPGGNVTGLTNSDVELAPKRMQLLKEVLPRLSRIAVLRNPTNQASELQFNATQAAAGPLGIELQGVDVKDPGEYEGAFLAMAKTRAGALDVLADQIFFSPRIAELALKYRLPTVFPRREMPEKGGLLSYGPSQTEQFRFAANYMDKIFKGSKPSDLPVEQATRFELVVNIKTAKALGVKIPNSILVRADKVIE
jgi:putative tryptophan/tyrosine transport system substrate-binding protein